MALEVAIMIEGQANLDWPAWKRIVRAVEDLGFAGLHRSDHFVGPQPPDQNSLELWVSLTWLADHTDWITFGPLVSPVSFRHPAMTARMASQVDSLSNGRLVLGLGAGWIEREHRMFGYDLLDAPGRSNRFQEALEVITRLLRSDEPVTFDGEYYQFHDAVLLPRPRYPDKPPILIGGNGPRRTLPLAAHYADEWNADHLSAERFAERSHQLDTLLLQEGRRPEDVRRSLMTGLVFGKNDAKVRQKLDGRNADDLRANGIVVGTSSEVVDQLGVLEKVGVQRVMLQWLSVDDIDGLEVFAQAVL